MAWWALLRFSLCQIKTLTKYYVSALSLITFDWKTSENKFRLVNGNISKFNPKIYDYSLRCEFANFDPKTQKLDGRCQFRVRSAWSYSGTIRALNGYTTENNSKPHCKKLPLCLVCVFLFFSRDDEKATIFPKNYIKETRLGLQRTCELFAFAWRCRRTLPKKSFGL